MSESMRVATVTLNPAIDQTVTIPNFQAGAVNRVQHSRSDPGGKGVNPAGCSPDIYAELVELVIGKGRAVALDTSGEGLRRALVSAPTLVKPNIHELVGRPLDSQAAIIGAAQDWLAKGIETVVVSMGAEGALFVEADAVVLCRPPRIAVKSTVGAGDAMVSGTVAGMMTGASLAECARLATAFSLSVISHIGAGLSSREEIETFKGQVIVQQLDNATHIV